MLSERLWRPSFAAVHGTYRARLARGRPHLRRTAKIWPLTPLDASLARHTTMGAIVSGVMVLVFAGAPRHPLSGMVPIMRL